MLTLIFGFANIGTLRNERNYQMPKTISRLEFARLMSEAAINMPATKTRKMDSPPDLDTFDYDAKSNAWIKASDILTSVGEPYATCTVDDDELEDGYKVVPLRTMKDIPDEIRQIIAEAGRELGVDKITAR